jgi:hypothetical protein
MPFFSMNLAMLLPFNCSAEGLKANPSPVTGNTGAEGFWTNNCNATAVTTSQAAHLLQE